MKIDHDLDNGYYIDEGKRKSRGEWKVIERERKKENRARVEKCREKIMRKKKEKPT